MGAFLHWRKLCRNTSFHFSKICVSQFGCSTKTIHTALTIQPLLKSNIPALVPSRTFWESFPSKSLSLYDKDGLDKKNHELVYRARIFNYAFYAQLISLNVLALQVYAVLRYAYHAFVSQEAADVMTHFGPFNVDQSTASLFFLGIFSLQNVVLYGFAQRAVLRIYYEEAKDKYTVVSLAVNPFKSRLVQVKPGEIVPRNVGQFMQIFGNHTFKNRVYIITIERFKNMMDYYKMIRQYE